MVQARPCGESGYGEWRSRTRRRLRADPMTDRPARRSRESRGNGDATRKPRPGGRLTGAGRCLLPVGGDLGRRRPVLVRADTAGARPSGHRRAAAVGDAAGRGRLAHRHLSVTSSVEPLQLKADVALISEAVIATEDRRFYSHFGVDPGAAARRLSPIFAPAMWSRAAAPSPSSSPRTFSSPPSARSPARPGGAAGALARAQIHQGPDPRDLSQSRLSRRRHLWRRRRGAPLFRQVGGQRDALRGRDTPGCSRRRPGSRRRATARRRPNGRSRCSPIWWRPASSTRPRRRRRRRASRARPRRRPPPGSRYFADWVAAQLAHLNEVQGRDVVVTTTLDPRMQAEAEAAVLRRSIATAPSRASSEGALVAMSPDGAVRAMVGGRDYADSQFNRATRRCASRARRSSRSSISAALERGMTPGDRFNDHRSASAIGSRTTTRTDTVGEVTAAEALAESINTVAAQVIERAGVDNVIAVAHRLGITADARPRRQPGARHQRGDAARPHRGLWRLRLGGKGALPYGITEIRDSNGTVLYRREGEGGGQRHRARSCRRDERDAGRRHRPRHRRAPQLDRPAAGKTGTTQDFATRGSSATPPISSPACGSATTTMSR